MFKIEIYRWINILLRNESQTRDPVSISPTSQEQLFHTEVAQAAFMHIEFRFIHFLQKDIGKIDHMAHSYRPFRRLLMCQIPFI